MAYKFRVTAHYVLSELGVATKLLASRDDHRLLAWNLVPLDGIEYLIHTDIPNFVSWAVLDN